MQQNGKDNAKRNGITRSRTAARCKDENRACETPAIDACGRRGAGSGDDRTRPVRDRARASAACSVADRFRFGRQSRACLSSGPHLLLVRIRLERARLVLVRLCLAPQFWLGRSRRTWLVSPSAASRSLGQARKTGQAGIRKPWTWKSCTGQPRARQWRPGKARRSTAWWTEKSATVIPANARKRAA